MSPIRALITLIVALFCVACSATVDRQPSPASVGHMGIIQKEEYIFRTKETLKVFHATGRDLRSRALSVPLQELAENFDRYVSMQVAPIVEDAEARSHLATRMEIAKLQLLCGLIYIEFEDHRKIEVVLLQMTDYETDPRFLSTPIERGDIGIASIEEGLELLRESVAEAAPRQSAKLIQQASAPGKDPIWKRIFSTPSPKGSSAP